MKVTVDLPESELRDICRITGISKKGPAIRQLVASALQLERRKEISGKFVSGDWQVDLAGLEESQSVEMRKTHHLNDAWRD